MTSSTSSTSHKVALEYGVLKTEDGFYAVVGVPGRTRGEALHTASLHRCKLEQSGALTFLECLVDHIKEFKLTGPARETLFKLLDHSRGLCEAIIRGADSTN